MAKKDYYEILGVKKNASEQEIKKAYRHLAMQFHPDRASHDKKKDYEEKFKEISEAYRILSDKNKRAQYDQYGHAFEGAPFGNEGFSQRDFGSFYDVFGGQDIFEDLGFDRIFEQMFGFKRTRSRTKAAQQEGQDIYLDLEMTLEEAFSGVEKEIDLNLMTTCSQCNGKGGSNFKKCDNCNGAGFQQVRSQSIFGYLIRQKECSKCQGQGQIPDKICSICHGKGRIKEIKTIKVKIPAGIDNNQSLKLTEQGEAGLYGGPAGDVLITVHIKPHKDFERRNEHLIYQLTINFTQAALGDKIEIPSIDSQISLKIPAGTQPDDLIKLKGKGMPDLYGHNRGDMIIQIRVKVPKHLNSAQKKIIEELKQTEKQNAFSKFFS